MLNKTKFKLGCRMVTKVSQLISNSKLPLAFSIIVQYVSYHLVYYGIRPPIVIFTIGEVNIDRASFYIQQLRVLCTRENLFSILLYTVEFMITF